MTIKTHKEVALIAVNLGMRIKAARIQRKLRQEDLSAMSGVSRSTIQSIERGDTTCSIGALLIVLWTMGLSAEVSLIADPGLDQTGLALSLANGKKRIFAPRKIDNDF